MKNIVGILLAGLLVVAIGGEVYYVLQKNNDDVKIKDNNTNNNTENENKEDNSNFNGLVSNKSIVDLGKDESLFIDTSLNLKLEVSYKKDKIFLEYIGKNLYLTYKTFKSKVINFNEQVIDIKSGQNACVLEENDILILTSTGNLYKIKGAYAEEKRFSEDIYEKIENNQAVEINFEKVNSEGVKVLAFTKSVGSKNYTCGSDGLFVYTNDKKFRNYQDFTAQDKIIINEEASDCVDRYTEIGSCGYVVYNDYTISRNNQDLLKTSSGNNIIYKDGFRDTDNNMYIVDTTNSLYILNDDEEPFITFKGLLSGYQKVDNKVIFSLTNDSALEVKLAR